MIQSRASNRTVVVNRIMRGVILNRKRGNGKSYHVFRKPIKRDLMRDFRDGQPTAHFRPIRGFARPLEFDFDIVYRDQPVRERNQRQKVN
jgi:hypothetical protein